MNRLNGQVALLSSQNELAKKEIAALKEAVTNSVKPGFTLVFDHKPVEDSLFKLDAGLQVWNTKMEQLVTSTLQIEPVSTHELVQARQIVQQLTDRFDQERRGFSSKLDELAAVVNQMEERFQSGVPEVFKNVSLTSNVVWSSPSLLCMRLREEYEQVSTEFADFKSKLSQESTTIVQAHQEQAEKIKELTSQLQDVSAKYQREKEEKDMMVATLKNSERAVYDAVKYKAALDEVAELRIKIDELKAALINEKGVRMNELYDTQRGISKVAELTEEVNRLTNAKTQFNVGMQKLKETYELQLRTKQYEIESLRAEKNSLVERTVILI